MKNKFVKALSVLSIGSILTCNISYADSVVKKNETIYVTKENNKIIDKTASIWLNSDENIKTKDKSNLKEIKNLKTDQSVKEDGGFINWNEDSKDIYYQGKMQTDLPVEVNVKYFLDGKEISFDQLKDKTGKLKVEISAVNKSKEKGSIKGKNTDIYSPYLVLTEVSFNSDEVSNIKTDDGKIVKDGKNDIVMGVLAPGLKENFSDILEDDKLDKFKDKFVIEMDIKNYKPAEIYAIISNEFFQDDLNMKSMDKLNDGIDELTNNACKLVDASDKLADGANKLDDGIETLADGSEKLSEGSQKLNSSFGEFAKAFKNLPDQIGPMTKAIDQLSAGGKSLNTGVNEYTKALSLINSNMGKLNEGANNLASGISELDDGIGQLNEATSMLKEKTSFSSSDDSSESFGKSLIKLQNGLDEFSTKISPLADSINKLDSSIGAICDSSKNLSLGLNSLNEKAKASPNIGNSIENIYAKANAIENVIGNLQANNEDGSLTNEIENLKAIENSLLSEANNLKKGAENSSNLLASIDQLAKGSESLSQATTKLKTG